MLSYSSIATNYIEPLFYEYFNTNTLELGIRANSEDEWLKIISSIFSSNPNKYENFENSVEYAYIKLLDLICHCDSDNIICGIYKTIMLIFLDSDKDAKELFLNLEHRITKENCGIFYPVGLLLKKYFNCTENQKSLNGKCCIVLSRDSNDVADHFYQKNIEKVKQEGIDIFKSQESPDYFEYLYNNDIVLFIGHGGNEKNEGFAYFYNWSDFIRIKGEYISLLPKRKVIGMLSCAIEPYKGALNSAEYFIIPNTAMAHFAEMFTKGFIRGIKKGLNIEDCIKLGLTALLLRSKDPIIYSVYKNGQIMNYIENDKYSE